LKLLLGGLQNRQAQQREICLSTQHLLEPRNTTENLDRIGLSQHFEAILQPTGMRNVAAVPPCANVLFLKRTICLRLATGWTVWVLNPDRSGFSAPVHTGPGAHLASSTMGIGSFPGVKRPGHGVDHPHQSSAEVKDSEKLYLYSPSVLLQRVTG
jgi:hypothetical protein